MLNFHLDRWSQRLPHTPKTKAPIKINPQNQQLHPSRTTQYMPKKIGEQLGEKNLAIHKGDKSLAQNWLGKKALHKYGVDNSCMWLGFFFREEGCFMTVSQMFYPETTTIKLLLDLILPEIL